jgi:hypothetical protein
MGDAAEYMMELQAEEEQWQAYKLFRQDEPRRPLQCWADGELDYIFDWEPGTKILGVFLGFHRQHKIGMKCFLSKGVPRESEVASGFNSRYACDKTNATHEILVASRKDAALMRKQAETARNDALTLKDRILADMLDAMADFIETESNRDVFVFARTL